MKIIATIILVQLAHPPEGAPDHYTGLTNPRTGQTCCGNQDCKPVSGDQIYDGDNYYEYMGMRIPKSQAQASFDGGWHVCIVGSPPELRCILVPTNT